MFDLLDAAQLVVGLVVGEGLLKFALPDIVGRKGEALEPCALCVELNEPGGQLLGRRLGARARPLPVGAAQLVEADLLRLAAADVLGDQVERGRGDVQEVGARKGDLDEVALGPVHLHALHADVAADAVVLVHDQIARRQVGVALDPVAVRLFCTAGFLARWGVAFGQEDEAQAGIF